MDRINQLLVNPSSANIIAIIAIIVSVVLGIILHRLSNLKPRPIYYVVENFIADFSKGNYPEGFKAIYNGQEIARLTKTSFYIKNAGKALLDGINKEESYVKILIPKLENNVFYDVKIDSQKCHAIVSYSKDDDGNILINIPFLDIDDSFRIDILHNSLESPKEIESYIKGTGKGFTNITSLIEMGDIIEKLPYDASRVSSLMQFIVKRIQNRAT